MTAWMIWTVVVSALIAIAAAMVERVVARFGLARRAVWIVAVLVVTVGPAVIAMRPVQRSDGNPRTLARQSDGTLGTTDAMISAGVAVWQRVGDFAAVVAKADVWVSRAWLVASGTMLI